MKTVEERKTAHREYMRKWGYANRELKNERNRTSYVRNRQPYLNRAALARAESENAAPKWLTKEHWQQIAEIYAMAQKLSQITGIRHDVDHLWPLKGINSCGLHVPWNLQVITHAANVEKSNEEPD